MGNPTFDSPLISSALLTDHGADHTSITARSYIHETRAGTRETMMVLNIGRVQIQTADPNWFRHLIDQANTALQSAGYPPHVTAANDDGTTTTKERGAA